MNMFLLPPLERMMAWRDFRNSITNLSEYEQLKEVAKLGALIPTIKFVIDPYKPESWPTPWELVNKGDFDEASISYFLEQTLFLLGWDEKRLKIVIANNLKTDETKISLLVDEKYLLNWYHGDIFDYEENKSECSFLMKYQLKDGTHVLSN